MDREKDHSHVDTTYVEHWLPPGVQSYVGFSGAHWVGLLEDGCSVLKYPHNKTAETMEVLYAEAARYERLGRHDDLVVFKGIHEYGLVFEFCEKGQLAEVVQYGPPLGDTKKREIGKQIVRCLIHLHEHNYIHCDVSVHNVFVTAALDAKVGDIQGQLYRTDGSIEMEALSAEPLKSRHPHAGEDEFSARTDIFALGTLLYFLWHGHEPFPELQDHRDEEIILTRYRNGEFPIDAQRATGMDKIISGCWNSSYPQAIDVLRDMDRLEDLINIL